MKEKYFLNARIIDPSQNIDEIGGLIVGSDGKIKSVGKNVKKGPSRGKNDNAPIRDAVVCAKIAPFQLIDKLKPFNIMKKLIPSIIHAINPSKV